ncbi:MAG TPA: HD domain-containing protein, partial [Verrucomicrobiae bacterium]|nr:HD domain-containing protein [Verrucomicrobiae bacterium]
MNDELERAFDFITWSAKLREVTRHNNAIADRKESVAEHSWHLALMCWVLSKQFEQELHVELDLAKMLKMATIHDLVEIDAGDPSVWSKNHADGKAEREEAVAQAHFTKLAPGLASELLELWHEYESGDTPESKVVRGVDRINPAIMRFTTGQGWTDVQGSVKTLDDVQLPRIGFSDTLTSMYEY